MHTIFSPLLFFEDLAVVHEKVFISFKAFFKTSRTPSLIIYDIGQLTLNGPQSGSP